jgi:hypothetical protein
VDGVDPAGVVLAPRRLEVVNAAADVGAAAERADDTARGHGRNNVSHEVVTLGLVGHANFPAPRLAPPAEDEATRAAL